MHSCIYDGYVRHRRFQPLRRDFQYRIAFLFLDLAELDQVLEDLCLLGGRRFSLASIFRPDHLGRRADCLDTAVRDVVADQTGTRPSGPIRMLTQWRTLGFYFSPINLFFCYDDEEQVQTVVAEVNNTPWREQHIYVLWSGNQSDDRGLAYRHAKAFHVSPYMDMNLEYDWRLSPPAERFAVHLETLRDTTCILDASMKLRRQELTNRTWLTTLMRFPLPAARILTAIYYEALRLWLKNCPYYPHPKTNDPSTLDPQSDPDRVATKVG